MALTKLQKSLVFYLGTLLVVVTLAMLSQERKSRYVPVDENHPRPLALAQCRDCHAPGRVAPQADTHPPKEQCMLCHRDALKKKR